jgi:hypothetical protein
LKISPTSLFGDGAISNSRMRAAILELNRQQGIPSPRAEHKAKLLALGIVSGHVSELNSRDAQASGLKRATPCHVLYGSGGTPRGFAMGVEKHY